jgi:hypothetical protein
MKLQTQKEIVLKELKMAGEGRIETSSGDDHKVDVEIGFGNMEIKVFRNEQLNLYEELKGMKEVLHQQEEELNTQWVTMENAQEIHHKDQKLLVAKEKKIWRELQVA